jgi:hypothetical protein
MGFLDKAKQLADQAQAKIDEAQDKFNAAQKQGESGGPAVRYDAHGRPIAEPENESAGATPPHGDPLAAPEPAAPPEPSAAPAPDPEAPEPAAEDRNRPSHAPPPLTGGDPLTG